MCSMIQKTAKQSTTQTGGKFLQIPKWKLVLLQDHPEGCYKRSLQIRFVCHQGPAARP